jgi:S-adenosylmethionine decarboxylase
MTGFGQHLMVDGYGGNCKKLATLDLIYQFLDSYPEEIRMTKIMPPYVFKYHGTKPDDWGLSGVVLIAESHISVHTFPKKRYLSVDIFSCKEFDAEHAVETIKKIFDLEKVEINLLERGQEFPKDLESAADIVHQERLYKAGPVRV